MASVAWVEASRLEHAWSSRWCGLVLGQPSPGNLASWRYTHTRTNTRVRLHACAYTRAYAHAHRHGHTARAQDTRHGYRAHAHTHTHPPTHTHTPVMMAIPGIFYVIILVGGFSLDSAREYGWLVDVSIKPAGLSDLTRLYDFSLVPRVPRHHGSRRALCSWWRSLSRRQLVRRTERPALGCRRQHLDLESHHRIKQPCQPNTVGQPIGLYHLYRGHHQPLWNRHR